MSRAERLQAFSIAVAVAAIIAAAAAALLTSEIRCAAHLQACPAAAPSPSHHVFVDGPSAPGEPFFVGKPRLPRLGTPTRVWLEQPLIVNPGKPVAVMLRGEGFQPEQIADIDWNEPDGSTYLGTATYVGRDGRFAVGLYWWPLQDMGIDGSNGNWQVRVTDRESRRVATTALQVTSDATTPPQEQWPSRYTWTPPAVGRPTVSVDVEGDVCHGNGARVEVTASGFPPDANISFFHLRTDGQRIGSQGWQTDGYGRTEHIVDYFWLNECDQDRDFRYRIVATVDDYYVEADIPLHAARRS